MYTVDLKFKGVDYRIGIIMTSWDSYNLELRTKEPLSGDDFQGLRNYLEEEGYVDMAREHKFN